MVMIEVVGDQCRVVPMGIRRGTVVMVMSGHLRLVGVPRRNRIVQPPMGGGCQHGPDEQNPGKDPEAEPSCSAHVHP